MHRIEVLKKLDGSYYDIDSSKAILCLIEMAIHQDTTQEERDFLLTIKQKSLIKNK